MNCRILFALLVGLELGIVTLNIPPALDALMGLYHASYTQMSVLISALLWSHALMQIPAGMIADRLGIGRTMLVSLSCMGLGNLLPAFVAALGLAIAGRIICGFGTAMSFVSLMKLIALYAPPKRMGSYQAFFGGSFSVGSIAAYLWIPPLVSNNWQWAYLIPGLISFPLLGILLAVGLRSQPSNHPTPLPISRILRADLGWAVGVYHALSYGSVLTLGNWLPSLLAELSGGKFSAARFAWGGALIMLISGLGRLSGGLVLLRFSPLLIANGSILLLGVLFAGLFLIPSPLPVFFLALLAGWFASINFGALFHFASKGTPSDSLATFFGFINLLANTGAIGFTLTFGWVKDRTGSFSWGFAMLACLSLIAFSLCRDLFRRHLDEV